MKTSEPARFASTYFAPSTCLRVSRPFVNNSLSTMAWLFFSGHGLGQLNKFQLSPSMSVSGREILQRFSPLPPTSDIARCGRHFAFVPKPTNERTDLFIVRGVLRPD